MAERHIFECDGLHSMSYDRRPQVDAPDRVPNTPIKSDLPANWIRVSLPANMRDIATIPENDKEALEVYAQAMPMTATINSAGQGGYAFLIFCTPMCAGTFLYAIASNLRKIERLHEILEEERAADLIDTTVESLIEDALDPLATVNDD